MLAVALLNSKSKLPISPVNCPEVVPKTFLGVGKPILGSATNRAESNWAEPANSFLLYGLRCFGTGLAAHEALGQLAQASTDPTAFALGDSRRTFLASGCIVEIRNSKPMLSTDLPLIAS